MNKDIINEISREKIKSYTGYDLREDNIKELTEKYIYQLYIDKKLVIVKDKDKWFDKVREFKKLIKYFVKVKGRDFMHDKYLYLFVFELILTSMDFYNIGTKEWLQAQRERLYRELKQPKEFKHHIEMMRQELKNKSIN